MHLYVGLAHAQFSLQLRILPQLACQPSQLFSRLVWPPPQRLWQLELNSLSTIVYISNWEVAQSCPDG